MINKQSGIVIEVQEPTSYEYIWTEWYVHIYICTYGWEVVWEDICYV